MKNIIINLLISFFSLVIIFSLFEIGTRLYKSEYAVVNFLGKERTLYSYGLPTKYDAKLGWIPKNGTYEVKRSQTTVTIIEDGIRANSRIPSNMDQSSNGLILAVGDSFTYGDQVSDNETWPAILEELAGKRVINGGVFGYGVDQSFLRMKILAAEYKPDIIIFSFIPNDISRCELSERTSVPKPYFDISEGNLILNDDHVSSYTPVSHVPGLFRKLFGYSLFIHEFMMSTFKHYWLLGIPEKYRNTQIHSKGVDVTCLIFKEIKNYAENSGVSIYILVQYPKNPIPEYDDLVDNVIKCVNKPLELVDIRESLIKLKKHDNNLYESLFDGHMSKKGNYFVAQLLRASMD